MPKDLKEYESLGDFFYRELKDGARPIAEAPMVCLDIAGTSVSFAH